MPKKNKTRKQKLLSDQRQSVKPMETPTVSYTLDLPAQTRKAPHVSPVVPTTAQTSLIDYSYLSKDLFKTLTLTGFIIVVELLLKAFL